MSNLGRNFNLKEAENGWFITDDYGGDGRCIRAWVARDIKDLLVVITTLCSPEEEDEKRATSS